MEHMIRTASFLTVFALLLCFGGIYGFVKAGSIASLVASTLSATLLGLSCIGLFRESFWGYPFALVVLSSLDALFFYRFYKTHAVMPSGVLFILCSFFLTTTILQMLSALRSMRSSTDRT